jgi:hypothetical protein
MSNRPLLSFIAVCAVALSASPSASAAGKAVATGACIDADNSTHWAPHDDHTILVWSGRRPFKVTTNTCPSLADPLARITKEIHGGSQICSPRDVRLYVARSGQSISTPCFIQSITPLTPEEARAIEARRR